MADVKMCDRCDRIIKATEMKQVSLILASLMGMTRGMNMVDPNGVIKEICPVCADVIKKVITPE